MLEIASHPAEQGVFQKDIAENQEISIKYLDHIIRDLKVAGLLVNAKGKKSGYVLTRPAEKITIYDIFQAFEPAIVVVECLSETCTCTRQSKCPSKLIYSELNSLIIEHLEGVTLRDLVKKQKLLELAELNPEIT